MVGGFRNALIAVGHAGSGTTVLVDATAVTMRVGDVPSDTI
jgi:hypothetical protein